MTNKNACVSVTIFSTRTSDCLQPTPDVEGSVVIVGLLGLVTGIGYCVLLEPVVIVALMLALGLVTGIGYCVLLEPQLLAAVS